MSLVFAVSPWRPSVEPLFLVLCVATSCVYLQAGSARPSGWRKLSFFSGIGLIAAALSSPIETIAAHYLLLFHLLQNVMISDWAPPLLLLGLTPAMRAALAQRIPRAVLSLTRPTRSLPIWLVGWYAIHLAGFYDLALRQSLLLNAEHLFLIVIGLIFWWPVISDSPQAVSTLARLGYLGAAFIGSGFLGLALTFDPNPIYDFYAQAPRLWGVDAGRDQNFGGILMTSEQAIVFFIAIGHFVVRLAREEDEETRRLDALTARGSAVRAPKGR